jgi:ABC-type uncharacterized transport system substrate-binding protein
MDRRAFVKIISLGLLVGPLAAEAQHAGKAARLGLLYGASPAFRPDTDPADRAFVSGLRAHGYVVGQNMVIDFRSALGGTMDRLPPLAAELVGLGVEVIVVTIEPAVRAVREASPTIPIVMAGASVDPVGAGLVASLARPGGNITGVTLGDLAGKRLELLRDALPGLRSVAAFHANPNIPIIAQWLRATEAAARRLGLALHPVRMPVVRMPEDSGQWEQMFETVFETVSRRGIGAVTIHEAPHLESHRRLLADLALKHRLPMVFTFRSQAEAGGLMSYAPDLEEIMRRAGSLAARILQGAKPADLPVEEPTKYQLVLNLKTAKALGLTIPQSVLLRADEVIQ